MHRLSALTVTLDLEAQRGQRAGRTHFPGGRDDPGTIEAGWRVCVCPVGFYSSQSDSYEELIPTC